MKRYILFALTLATIAMQAVKAQQTDVADEQKAAKTGPGHYICDRTYGFEAGVMAAAESGGKDHSLLLALALDWDSMPEGRKKEIEAAFYTQHMGHHPSDLDLSQLSQHAVAQAMCAAEESTWRGDIAQLQYNLKKLQTTLNSLKSEDEQFAEDLEMLKDATVKLSNDKKALLNAVTTLRLNRDTGDWRKYLGEFQTAYKNYAASLEDLSSKGANLGLLINLSNDLIDTSVKFETGIAEIDDELQKLNP